MLNSAESNNKKTSFITFPLTGSTMVGIHSVSWAPSRDLLPVLLASSSKISSDWKFSFPPLLLTPKNQKQENRFRSTWNWSNSPQFDQLCTLEARKYELWGIKGVSPLFCWCYCCRKSFDSCVNVCVCVCTKLEDKFLFSSVIDFYIYGIIYILCVTWLF